MSSQSASVPTASLGKLQISQAQSRGKKAEPADSWEDEAEDSGSETVGEGTSTPVCPETSDPPRPPPPTPASPTSTRDHRVSYSSVQPFDINDAVGRASSTSRSATAGGEDKRPDKTTSVASRLIAAAIGQKAPRRTREEREYDQAMKIQEKKKRDKAREEEERKKREKENALKAIWDD